MNFRRGRAREEPEINLIPLIDILIVVLIFLFLTTTYSRFAELQINLPESAAEKSPDRPQVLAVAVDADQDVVAGRADGEVERVRRTPGRVVDHPQPFVVGSEPGRDLGGAVPARPHRHDHFQWPRISLGEHPADGGRQVRLLVAHRHHHADAGPRAPIRRWMLVIG